MKKVLLATALLGASFSVHAAAPGGPGCGWGNLLFEGKSGTGMHLLATVFNGSTGNATFGMSSGTNGCDTSGALTYSGESLLSMNGVLEEVAQDAATGNGEALTALSVSMGIQTEDRAQFNALMHQNFATIFPRQDVSAGEVMQNITALMQKDQTLAKYV